MPLPALAGIPWLASLLGGLFAGFFAWFLKFAAKRFAFVAAAISLIVVVTTAFFAAIEAVVATLSATAPDWVNTGASMIIPNNATACIAAYIAALVLRYTYFWAINIIYMKFR